jgi:hypothetical protein
VKNANIKATAVLPDIDEEPELEERLDKIDLQLTTN